MSLVRWGGERSPSCLSLTAASSRLRRPSVSAIIRPSGSPRRGQTSALMPLGESLKLRISLRSSTNLLGMRRYRPATDLSLRHIPPPPAGCPRDAMPRRHSHLKRTPSTGKMLPKSHEVTSTGPNNSLEPTRRAAARCILTGPQAWPTLQGRLARFRRAAQLGSVGLSWRSR